eukprot:7129444-Ditylum_brightwellii.AAC.1
MKVVQEKHSFFLDVQKEGLRDCFPDKWEIDIMKKFMTGWSLSLYSQNVPKKDTRSIASNLFFLGNHYKYKNDDQKMHGSMSAMPFMDKVKDTW